MCRNVSKFITFNGTFELKFTFYQKILLGISFLSAIGLAVALIIQIAK
jgi:hypothetical protein